MSRSIMLQLKCSEVLFNSLLRKEFNKKNLLILSQASFKRCKNNFLLSCSFGTSSSLAYNDSLINLHKKTNQNNNVKTQDTETYNAISQKSSSFYITFQQFIKQQNFELNASQAQVAQQLDTLQQKIIHFDNENIFQRKLHQRLNQLIEFSKIKNKNLSNPLQEKTNFLKFMNLFSQQRQNTAMKKQKNSNANNVAAYDSNDKVDVRSVYVYGDVGQGKTLLMDLFYNTTPIRQKLRKHFYEFMIDVHKRLHAIHTQRQLKEDEELNPLHSSPILNVAYSLASSYSLICLDEFQVLHISDAMILKSLIENLQRFGCIFVVTTNRPPKDLYLNGLNRNRFLPFIHYVTDHWKVLCLSTGCDYRQYKTQIGVSRDSEPLERPSGGNLYNVPCRDIFTVLAQMPKFSDSPKNIPTSRILNVSKNRQLIVPYQMRNVALFPYRLLCETAKGPEDYMTLANNYKTVFLHNVKCMDNIDTMPDTTRRFIQLIDILYENKSLVIFDSNSQLLELFGSNPTMHAFKRLKQHILESYSNSLVYFFELLKSKIEDNVSDIEKRTAEALYTMLPLSSRDASLIVQTVSTACKQNRQLQWPKIKGDPNYNCNVFLEALVVALKAFIHHNDNLPKEYFYDAQDFLNNRSSPIISKMPFNFYNIMPSESIDSFAEKDNKFAIQRTISRVHAMLSEDYVRETKAGLLLINSV